MSSNGLGQSASGIDTPALVLDLDAMERNLSAMASFADRHHVRLRPHAKMHKCAELALLQIAAGAVGVCVQKPSEAVALFQAGVPDIFISNEVIAPHKLLALRTALDALTAVPKKLAIAVDSLRGIASLADAFRGYAAGVDVFIEIDAGQGRCGVAPGASAVPLAQELARHPQLRFAGLQAYHGRAQHLRSAAARACAIQDSLQRVRSTVAELGMAGFVVPLVTGGGSGSFAHEATSGLYGELQCGSYLFMDRDYADNERDAMQPEFEHALFVKSQVMSVCASYAVCDAGHKSHALDSGLPTVWSLEGQAALTFESGGDEHGILRGDVLPQLGDTIWLVPGHCDPTVNLHSHMWGVRGGLASGAVECVFTVDARGALT